MSADRSGQLDEHAVACRHCGQPTFREGAGRWAHEYEVRGHLGPWLYCPPPHETRPQPYPTRPDQGARDE